ncbi:MAG: TolC family protein [Bacteroidetes bacterium]|nr:TolC family protein [Bacteroidota bacterium]
MKKMIRCWVLLLIVIPARAQQRLGLDSIFSLIASGQPSLRSYDAQVRSLDAAAAGARSWDAPLLSTGLWMTPYNPGLWKKQSDGSPGMGQYMLSAQQMFPNKKRQAAEEQYMLGMSAVEKEKKNALLNELYAAARQNYYEWIIIEKKLAVLEQDQRLLDFMQKNAELRYKNNVGKLNAYYKVKASIGLVEQQRIVLENELQQKRIMLNTLMSRDKGVAFEIDTNYQIRQYNTASFDSSTLAAARSDIRAVDNDIRLAGLQQEAEKAKLKPEFGVRYDHMFGFGGFPMQYSLMGMVRLPMAAWSSRASKANVQSLRWKTEALGLQRQAMINEAVGKSWGLQNEIVSKQKQLRLFEDNIIPALRKNFQAMQLAYEQNTEELFTLYDAWETLNMTQLSYWDQLQQLLLLQVELEKTLEIK